MYHPQANGLVERGHESIVNSLAKYSKEPGYWVKHLSLALWADWISVRRSTGYSPFELVYGRGMSIACGIVCSVLASNILGYCQDSHGSDPCEDATI